MSANIYYDDIVNKRESCRDFLKKDVEFSKLDALRKYYNSETGLIPEIETEFRFYGHDTAAELDQHVGYNGFLIEAPVYAALYTDRAEHCLENAGYLMEGIVLKMTELGLASCWLTINDAEGARAVLKEKTGRDLAAIVAFGYRNRDKKAIRIDIKSPSDVNVVKIGTKAAPKIDLDELLSYKVYGQKADFDRLYAELQNAVLAIRSSQSFLNRQPYRVILDDDMISLIGRRDEMTSKADTLLNYGIVMFNFYSVISAVFKDVSNWDFNRPDRDLQLKDGFEFIAKCRI